VERVELPSRSIKAAGYDPERSLLEVEFRSGVMYRYGGVPEKVYQEFLTAESHGRYFNQNIRNRYLTVKIAPG
jgi:KTSC domain